MDSKAKSYGLPLLHNLALDTFEYDVLCTRVALCEGMKSVYESEDVDNQAVERDRKTRISRAAARTCWLSANLAAGKWGTLAWGGHAVGSWAPARGQWKTRWVGATRWEPQPELDACEHDGPCTHVALCEGNKSGYETGDVDNEAIERDHKARILRQPVESTGSQRIWLLVNEGRCLRRAMRQRAEL